MAGTASEEFGVGRFVEEISTGQERNDALVEWRSSEQLEIGTPSTSPPYWDSDDEDDNGPKPAELYGKYTWKIDKFSQINKRELRSSPFEIGGYKWYILIYPQGCDVCNHLSLFLCVANHDKLLPGWSHFAQFTIAVVNKDPKKSKYSDTLHRFWKKEHDWGWKKFMELSKVLDGFIDGDTLIIKAQVQVIRERADRPFRCLDCNFRRELIRVYLTNVEQICRRFVEERRGKLRKLIEDKSRWTSFCTFWLGMDKSVRREMSWEKTDSILKVIAKNFFIEKEVTSTLVMDSLYSGMKALESQYSKNKIKKNGDIVEELLPSAPIVRMDKDMFVLVDDVLLLFERAALEPLPPKDDKGPQNRTKDGSSGDEFNKDSIERDERRLTELGRRTIEIFVLAHIFSKIDVAYQEAVSLKRQEELIREEEAAEFEQKTRRGSVDKEKKSKKKQGKQKRNNRKTKDKVKDEKPITAPVEPETVTEKVDLGEDVLSDVSDSLETHNPDNSDNTPDLQPITLAAAVTNGGPGGVSIVDDSSSTCSTDSIPSVLFYVNKGKTFSYLKSRRHERGKSMEADWSVASANQIEISRSFRRGGDIINSQAVVTKGSNQPEFKKDNTQLVVPTKNSSSLTSEQKISNSSGKSFSGGRLSDTKKPVVEVVTFMSRSVTCKKPDPPEKPVSTHQVPVVTEKPLTVTQPVTQKVAVVSRSLSSDLVQGSSSSSSKPMVQTSPLLSRSSSSASWTNHEPSSTATSSYNYVPQSYRNVMMGGSNSSPTVSSSVGFAQPPPPLFNTSSQSSERAEVTPIKSSFSPFGMTPDVRHWIETPPPPQTEDAARNMDDIYNQMNHHSTSGRVNNGLADEFPHMGIINDLLEDDSIGKTNSSFHTFNNGGQNNFHRQFSLPNDNNNSGIVTPSTSSSCRFERTLSYHDGLHHHHHHAYYVSPYETLPPQQSYRPYAANGHQNQWHMGGGNERPYNDGYPPYNHNHGEFINMASCGRINYSGFHPSSNGN